MPDWKEEVLRRLAPLKLAPARELELAEELAAHLGDRYDELRSAGIAENEAREEVLRELHNADIVTAESFQRAGEPRRTATEPGAPKTANPLLDLMRDLRYGARAVRRSPAITAFIVATVAVGIGANTTVFTIINTFLLNPLPVRNASELVAVASAETKTGAPSADLLPVSFLNLRDLQRRNAVFSGVAGYTSPTTMTLADGAGSRRLFAEVVTANYFDTLGLSPAAGRFFSPGASGPPEIVVSYAAWKVKFGGAADLLRRTLRINNVNFAVIGIAPKGFMGVNAIFGPDVWIPAGTARELLDSELRASLNSRGAALFHGVGRLRPGVTEAQADGNLKAVGAALESEYPDVNAGRTLEVRPIREALFGGSQAPMLFGSIGLMVVVAVVLLMACCNVANLLLARAASRRQEVAVRLAMGANRGRLIRQLLTESILLGLLSGLVGLAAGVLGNRLVWAFRPAEVAANLPDPKLDFRVFAFTVAVALITGLVFGLAPALSASRADVVEALKEESRSAGRSRRAVSFANTLIVGQVAVSLVALVTAALFVQSLRRAYGIDPGFDAGHLAVFMVNPGELGYGQARTEQFYREVRARVAALPGVSSDTWSQNMPLWGRVGIIQIEGREQRSKADAITTITNTVDTDYFRTMRIAMLEGRDFTADDRDGALPVAIVNDTLAKRYWPNQEAIGKRLKFPGDARFRQVVGVVRTANYSTIGEPPQPCVYVPLRQNYSSGMTLYVRSAREASSIMTAVQHEIRAVDPQISVTDVRTGRTIIDQGLWGPKIGATLLGVFGLLALGLASIGLYGVLAYSVIRRRREIGVRMAMGAERRSVLALVLRQGMTLVGVGLAIGIVVSLLLGRVLSSHLYGVSAGDPASLASALGVLLAVAMLACWAPAWAASRVDPITALRES
ncbi:MAG TPA: ABC transporter permease [Bryobacteraceae bacterium]|nr:ABC transporter permease [Bryobacteraceae bacterium]